VKKRRDILIILRSLAARRRFSDGMIVYFALQYRPRQTNIFTKRRAQQECFAMEFGTWRCFRSHDPEASAAQRNARLLRAGPFSDQRLWR
jgi:hypothetical protein